MECEPNIKNNINSCEEKYEQNCIKYGVVYLIPPVNETKYGEKMRRKK